MHMTGAEFVRLCRAEKDDILQEYFSPASGSEAAERIRALIASGTDRDALLTLIDLVMTESWYRLLLGLDGAASLGGTQMTYQVLDADGTLLNECGELEESAFAYFQEESGAET